MEFSLETAGLATTIGLGVITLTLVYLWLTVVRIEAIAWWAVAFAALAVDYSMIMLKPLLEFGILIPAWEATHATFLCCVTIGVFRFLDRAVPFKLIVLAWLINVGWGVNSAVHEFSFVVQTVPATIVAVGLTAWSSVLLLRQRPQFGEPGYRLAGWAFAVWSFNRANFPLLAFMPWFAPFGYVIAEAAALAMGIGLLVAVLERLRRQALHSEEEARFSRNQVMDVMEASPVGTVVSHPQTGEILFANRTFRKLDPNWSDEKQLNDSLKIIEGPSWQEMAELVLPNDDSGPGGTEEAPAHELWAYGRDGEKLCLLNVVRPIYWANKWRIQNTLIDITRLKIAEAALAAARDEAEAASHSKTRFLAAASHDLRQPLQALMMFIDAFDMEAMDAENTRIKERVESSLEALKRLLDTLLDISRLDAGLILADMRPVALRPIMERLADELTPMAEEKGLAIGVVTTERAVMADPTLLETLLRNLITNAVRYTDEGRILIGCRHGEQTVKVGVWDTGQGIEEADLGKIFEDFHQVGNRGRDRRKGLGLGLSIVRRMADLMGMEVTVRSVPGKGSAFILEAASAAPPKHRVIPSEPAAKPAVRKNALIILIEDEQDILEAMSDRLRSMGHRVEAFCDVPVFEQDGSVNRNLPDLIIADYRLSEGRTGIAAIKTVREHFSSHIPAVLLTGDTSPEQLTEIRTSGFPFLHKPVAVPELKKMVDEMLDDGELSTAPGGQEMPIFK